MFAGHKKLDNLCVIVDYNGLQIDGPISEVAGPEPFDSKFAAFGFDVQVVDGHDFEALGADFEKACPVARTALGNGQIAFMRQRTLVDFAVDWMQTHRQ